MKLGKMKSSFAFAVGVLVGGSALCGSALAGETLFSNYVFSVAPAGENGKLWAFSQDNTYSGITYLSFSVAKDGSIVTEPTKREQVSDTLTAVHDGMQYSVIPDEQAEYRRIPAIYAGTNLGYEYLGSAPDRACVETAYVEPTGAVSGTVTMDV